MPHFDASPDWFASVFLIFFLYSFFGWVIETVFCSIQAKKFIKRGFLYGPYCPIYGGGVLLMLFVFSPLSHSHSALLFFLAATVALSSWEYLVGWFLEAATGVKYWDYSNYRFHLHGRVSLVICLCWGLLAYLVVYLIHPAVSSAFFRLSSPALLTLAAVCACVFFTDVIFTVRRLALITRIYKMLESLSEQLRTRLAAQLELGSAGTDAVAAELKERYDELVARLESATRRLRLRYPRMSSRRYDELLRDVQEAGARVRDRFLAARPGSRKRGNSPDSGDVPNGTESGGPEKPNRETAENNRN